MSSSDQLIDDVYNASDDEGFEGPDMVVDDDDGVDMDVEQEAEEEDERATAASGSITITMNDLVRSPCQLLCFFSFLISLVTFSRGSP